MYSVFFIPTTRTVKPYAAPLTSFTGYKEEKLLPDYFKPVSNPQLLEKIRLNALDNRWDEKQIAWREPAGKGYTLDAIRANLDRLTEAELIKLAQSALTVIENVPEDIQNAVDQGKLPDKADRQEKLKTLIVHRQFQSLYELANHAYLAENLGIPPLSVGNKAFKKMLSLLPQWANFVGEEGKHGDALKKYLYEHLETPERPLKGIIVGGNKLIWAAEMLPGMGALFAVAIEAIGKTYFEFMAKHAPDPLFREMCERIETDEFRHIELSVLGYNSKFRHSDSKADVLDKPAYQHLDLRERDRQRRKDFDAELARYDAMPEDNSGGLKRLFENTRNQIGMRLLIKQLYKDRARKDHYFMQACAAFGQDRTALIDTMIKDLRRELTRIGIKFNPDWMPPKELFST